MDRHLLAELSCAALAVVAASCASAGGGRPSASPAAEEHMHPGATQIAVSPDGRFVVTADGGGGLRALDTKTGGTADLRPGPFVSARPTSGRLEFTSDGILIGVPWIEGDPADRVGLRAGTWETVLVPAAPRTIRLFGSLSGLPEEGLPATERALPTGGCVLGLVGFPGIMASHGRGSSAVQPNFDGTEWTVWEATTGRTIRTLDAFPIAARPGAPFRGGDSLIATQYHAVLRLDLGTGRREWWADPFEVGGGEPPLQLLDFLHWALRASSEKDEPPPRTSYEVIGVARGDDRVVVAARHPRRTPSPEPGDLAPPTAPPASDDRGRPGVSVAVLDTATGGTVWRRRCEDPDATAWIGPGGRTVLLVEGGVARLLDVADGHDVTPTGWPGGPLAVRAAASEPGGDGLWVLLTDGRVRRLSPP